MIVRPVVIGTFKLDGGAMFGVVPKSLWQRLNEADENNLCTWGLNSVLIETGDRKILVDTGVGDKQGEKFKKHFAPNQTPVLDLLENDFALSPEEITDVFLTHYHFDHVGGAVTEKDGKLLPTFPEAKYWTNEVHYKWAYEGNPREDASFLHENFVPLREQGRLEYLDIQKDDLEWMPGIKVRFLYGHTEAMMMLIIEQEDKTLYFPTDLMPSQWHVRLPYIMSYDLQALLTMQEKQRLLSELEDTSHLVYFQHDPYACAGTISKDERGRYKVENPLSNK